MNSAMFVEVTRSGLVESVHRFSACAVGSDGQVLLQAGTIDAPVYLRSTAKPFIASAAIDAGTHERFGFSPQEIAVTAASHSGEPFHITAVRSILRKIGLRESDLLCGPEGEGHPSEPIYNNCSGKHAGILALCIAMGADYRTYLQADNPAQRRLLDVCAQMSGESADRWHVGIDGCGIPVYATSLRNAARSYRRFAKAKGISQRHSDALRIVRDAMIAHPEYVSGTGEFDAQLMHAARGEIACKGGAEGVHGAALVDRGCGVVLKIEDGTSRARAPAALKVLQALGALDERQLRRLDAFAQAGVFNKAGVRVGEIRARDDAALGASGVFAEPPAHPIKIANEIADDAHVG